MLTWRNPPHFTGVVFTVWIFSNVAIARSTVLQLSYIPHLSGSKSSRSPLIQSSTFGNNSQNLVLLPQVLRFIQIILLTYQCVDGCAISVDSCGRLRTVQSFPMVCNLLSLCLLYNLATQPEGVSRNSVTRVGLRSYSPCVQVVRNSYCRTISHK